MAASEGPKKALIVAISGPSCSGKTTLSRLLRDALTNKSDNNAQSRHDITTSSSTSSPEENKLNTFIIHQDDFYVSDAQIPTVTTRNGTELQDWDCREAIDFGAFAEMLQHVKHTGRLKDGFESKEDTNAIGDVHVDWDQIAGVQQQLRRAVEQWVQRTGGLASTVAIVDGFLLFAEGLDDSLTDAFDVRLLLPVDHDTVKRRREARKGYVTLEGFWEDPPGYVDDIVWPNYVKDHKFLYREGRMGSGIDPDVCRRLGIHDRPQDCAEDMTTCFVWAARLIIDYLNNDMTTT